MSCISESTSLFPPTLAGVTTLEGIRHLPNHCPPLLPPLMQATGTYLSRSLSYQGAEFVLDQIELDPMFK